MKRAILEARSKRNVKKRLSKKQREEKIYRHRQVQHEHLHGAYNENMEEIRGIRTRGADGSFDSSKLAMVTK